LLFRLARTIRRVVADPNRAVGWKIFDVLFLGVGVVLVVLCLVSAGSDWLFLYFFLRPIVYVATERSWWEMPRMSRTARRRLDEARASKGAVPQGPWRTWDPIDAPAQPPSWR
jgi:hypothetical protein